MSFPASPHPTPNRAARRRLARGAVAVGAALTLGLGITTTTAWATPPEGRGPGVEHPNAGDDAVISFDRTEDCDLVVTSTKDLSNIIVRYTDETEYKWDGLSDPTKVLTDDEANPIVEIWVKSGNNKATDDDPRPTYYDSQGVGAYSEVDRNCTVPEESTDTDDSEIPEGPGDQDDSELPETPGNPDPGNPGTSGDPGTPANPGEPGTPGTPGTPEVPGTPQRPETPQAPQNPGTDAAPVTQVPVQVAGLVQVPGVTPAVAVVTTPRVAG